MIFALIALGNSIGARRKSSYSDFKEPIRNFSNRVDGA
jgi:hypothetical protein